MDSFDIKRATAYYLQNFKIPDFENCWFYLSAFRSQSSIFLFKDGLIGIRIPKDHGFDQATEFDLEVPPMQTNWMKKVLPGNDIIFVSKLF